MKILTTLALTMSLVAGLWAEPTSTVRFKKRNYYPDGGPTTATYNGWKLYDDFTLTTAEKLTGIGWLGLYVEFGKEDGPPTPNTESWEITIYADHEGRPGSLLFSETQSADKVETTHLADRPWAPDPSIHSYYSFKMDFGENTFVAEAGRKYWVSIYSNSANAASGPLFGVLPGISDSANYDAHSSGSLLDPGSSLIGLPNGSIRERERKSDMGMELFGVPLDDADHDGMLDQWEESNQLDVTLDDSLLDPDGDGLNNLGEFERGCDPHRADTDRDGLPDGVETDTRVFVDATDTGTSPLKVDTDRDGIRDPAEITGTPATNPNRADSDDDGYTDLVEIQSFTDPNESGDFTPPRILSSLGGGDLTDLENDGDPDTGSGFDAQFDATDNPGFAPEAAFRIFDNEIEGAGSQWYEADARRYLLVTATFPEPFVLSSFAITNGSLNEQYDPSDWEIQGSVDGVTFETIFRRNDNFTSIWTDRNQPLLFEAGVHFRKPRAYSVFRFHSNYTLGDQSLQLGEVEFFGTPLPPQITKVDPPGRVPKSRPGDHNSVSGIRIEWESRPGAVYELEGSSNRPKEGLSTELREWVTLRQITSNGVLTRYHVEDPRVHSVFKWFRVKRIHGGAVPDILEED